VRLLLDTHVLLWVLAGSSDLDHDARELIRDGQSVVFVSAATAWEMSVKKALGKLVAPDDLEEQLRRHRFTPLAISVRHALAVGRLPMLHTDPFDRMLVAQAQTDGLTIMTRDEDVARYDVPLVSA
jgi:PIN domain nuclease of toxin-antitoxin system